MIVAVLDTNVLVSGLLFGGVPKRVIDAALEGRYLVVTSQHQLDELRRVLDYPRLASHIADADALVALFGEIAETIDPTPMRTFSRDPDDDHIGAIAITAGADALVTGDDDLLALAAIDGTRIVSPREFLDMFDDGGA